MSAHVGTQSPEPVHGSTNDEIAEALTRLYQFFIRIGYLREEQVVWPPHPPSDLNVNFCAYHGLDYSAIDLLQKIPWPMNPNSLEHESDLVNFSDRDELLGSRHPDFPDEPADEESNPMVEGWIVPITVRASADGYGVPISIDTKTGRLIAKTAFELTGYDPDDDPDGEETYNPVSYFDNLIQEYGSLDSMPVNGIILTRGEAVADFEEYDLEVCYAKTKEAFRDFGWPGDAFDPEEWRDYMDLDLWEDWTTEANEKRYIEQLEIDAARSLIEMRR